VHYWRFHEWWGTYLAHIGPYIAAHPELPAGWPLSQPFLEGFTAQLWSRFSVFFFEPLLLLPVLFLLFRKPVDRPAIVMMTGLIVTLLIAVVMYSKIQFWYGGNSWGPRYLTVPAEMCGALGAAVLASIWPRLSFAQTLAAGWLCGAAVVIQVSSVVLDDSLELVQNIAGRPVVIQRFVNLWHFVSSSDGTSLGWRLYPSGTPHITLFPWIARLYLGPAYGVLTLIVWLCLVASALWLTAKVVRSAASR
jgi:hypothetical protein